jgi:hypothetical protein
MQFPMATVKKNALYRRFNQSGSHRDHNDFKQRLDFALLPLRRSDARLVPGLALAHLLQPHRDPHINPVERFYLDTEMSESRVRLPSSFHPPLQAQSSITRTRTYRSVGFYVRWTWGPCL